MLAAVLCATVSAESDVNVRVAVDPRVELMSIIFRMARNPEYNQGRLTCYLNDIDAHFAAHRDHPVIQTAQELRRTRGVSFDAVMSMAIHLTDGLELRERVPLDAPETRLDMRWRADEARQFLQQAREFVDASDFRGFIERHRELYELAGQRMQALLDEHADLAWFEMFFGARPTARFIVVPAPVNGGQAYGPSVWVQGGEEELYAIIGVWQVDERGAPQFDRRVISTVIHEFCHSFVNHLVDHHEAELRNAGERIFPLVADAMKRQAYGTWQTMMRESVVRAAVIRYLMAHDNDAAARQMEEELRRGFHWMPKLAALLDEYESNRAAYPKFEHFMPRIVKLFDDVALTLAQDLQKAEAELDAKRPKVLSTQPAHGAENVDPNIGFIVITFDRAMSTTGHSLMHGPGGEKTFPHVLFASFDQAGRVFTIKVQLEPERRYEFSLNGEHGGRFRAADGTPLKRFPIEFATGPAKP